MPLPADPSGDAVTALLGDDPAGAAAERAVAEVRAGRPVLLTHGAAGALVCGAEAFDARIAAGLKALAQAPLRLALTAPRLKALGAPRAEPGTIGDIDPARVARLALDVGAHLAPDDVVMPLDPLDVAALDLLGLALVAPAAVVAPAAAAAVPQAILRLDVDAVRAHRARQATRLAIVGRAPVPLEGAGETEFVVFRGGEGLRDQVAVVVGTPDPAQAVPVRLHSACLTGDLFGSLKCDCGDQLRDTVQRMAREGGGILLYLDQEGRGNGIANKMRAYNLQAQGFDTYDADAVLGFDLDQRRFDFAAEMLRQLGVHRVQLITNNPLKVAALKAAGLDVVAEHRVLGRPTAENVRYLAAKRDRTGHFIDFDALAARATD